jgi:hypothetical protein
VFSARWQFDTPHWLLALNTAKVVLFVLAPFVRCNSYNKHKFLHIRSHHLCSSFVHSLCEAYFADISPDVV